MKDLKLSELINICKNGECEKCPFVGEQEYSIRVNGEIQVFDICRYASLPPRDWEIDDED